SGQPGIGQQRVELASDPHRVARFRPVVAPADPRPVVRTDACRTGDLGLDDVPISGAVGQAGLQDDGGTALAGAVDVKAGPADVHELAGWWVGALVLVGCDRLVAETRRAKHEGRSDY